MNLDVPLPEEGFPGDRPEPLKNATAAKR